LLVMRKNLSHYFSSYHMTECGERGLSIQNPFFKNLGKKLAQMGKSKTLDAEECDELLMEKIPKPIIFETWSTSRLSFSFLLHFTIRWDSIEKKVGRHVESLSKEDLCIYKEIRI
jgi:hypothetical protein